MTAYILRRLMLMVPVLLGIILVVTFSMEIIPGDPASMLLGQFATPESVAKLRRELDLDKPFIVRYFLYIKDLLRGDLGRSISLQKPVLEEIRATLPVTMQLAGASLVLVVLISIPLGTIAAANPNSLIDNIIRVFSLTGLSMPVYWSGLLLMVLFSVQFGVLPVGGYGGIKYLILPAFTLALPSIGMVTRMVRSSVMEVLGEDYVKTARAKGLKENVVLYKHVLRNGFIPVITVIGTQFGRMLGGSVLTETIFSWPGLGRLTVHAVFRRDFILMQGVVLVLALVYLIVNFLVDLSYGFINPEITYD